ncbi:transcription antitermination protein [Halobaculum sp. D14]|uniref:transcription antitermination protein n=1 Tax=unclassified Halobaculum TaxID=2640896 RepID=UPI003EBC87EE
MDADAFDDEVRDAHETPLSRLGSSKSLYALTGGEMAADAVRGAVAAEYDAAAETFEAWSADEGSGDAAALFGAVAEESRDARDAVAPDDGPADRDYPEYETLADLDASTARAGGLYARCLLAHTRVAQAVGFFVGDADPTTAAEFRGHRDDLDGRREDALDLLAELCDTDDDWAAARNAADAVVEAAYDDYVDTLEGMGVQPKNVC